MAALLAQAAVAEARLHKMKQALIIFVRNPVLGKVKTRIAATIGNEDALKVYKHLLAYTNQITQPLPVAKFVFYADFVNDDDLWNGYAKKLQHGTDLGERMKNAFDEIFNDGYSSACIIGSDCRQLTTKISEQAFSSLQAADCVIGPAADGGYYLLGMKAPLKNLFENIVWSSENVFAATRQIIYEKKLSHAELPILKDVDEASDIDFDY